MLRALGPRPDSLFSSLLPHFLTLTEAAMLRKALADWLSFPSLGFRMGLCRPRLAISASIARVLVEEIAQPGVVATHL